MVLSQKFYAREERKDFKSDNTRTTLSETSDVGWEKASDRLDVSPSKEYAQKLILRLGENNSSTTVFLELPYFSWKRFCFIIRDSRNTCTREIK